MEKYDLYSSLLTVYPAYISKERLCEICHISKRTALYLLETGLLPSIVNDKKTRRYQIKLTDAITYLKQKELDPEQFSAPQGWYQYLPSEKVNIRISQEQKRDIYLELLRSYPDLLSVKDVSKILGYSCNAISSWCRNGHIHAFMVAKQYWIPKPALFDYMMSMHFRRVREKSEMYNAIQIKDREMQLSTCPLRAI